MPNWVTNVITVNGDSDDIIGFINRHINDEGYFDFNTIIPEPKYKVETSSKYILSEEEMRKSLLEEGDDWFDWYNWRLKYWGTKWNAQHAGKLCFDLDKIAYEDIRSIKIVFDTAWTAPIPVAKKLTSKYKKKLRIRWEWYSFESDIVGYVIRDDYGDGDIPGFYFREVKF